MPSRLTSLPATLLLSATFVIAGCSHEMLKPAPPSTTPIAVIYTGKNISGASDLPIGTYQIPDSQVFISGHQSASKSPASMMFGLVGVLVANQMDKNKGETAVSSSSGSLHLRLNTDAQEDLGQLLASDEFKDHFTAAAVRGDPELHVRGSIVLTFIDDTHVLPYVVLHATLQKYWKNPQLQDPQILWSTRYMSSIGAPKPLGGTGSWTENDAASLKATIAAELKQVMHYMLADVAKPVPRDEAHRILVTGNFPFVQDRLQIVAYDLGENGDSIVFAPHLGDGTVLSGVLMVDKSQVTVREAQKEDRSKKAEVGK